MNPCENCGLYHAGPCPSDSEFFFTGRGIYETLPGDHRTSWSPRFDELTDEVQNIYNQAASQVERLRRER